MRDQPQAGPEGTSKLREEVPQMPRVPTPAALADTCGLTSSLPELVDRGGAWLTEEPALYTSTTSECTPGPL